MSGNAQLGANLNSWPRVTRITASPSFLGIGETATVEALASDLDGDTVSYQWSTFCSGSFSNSTTRTTSFTAADPGYVPMDGCAPCSLNVALADGRGGTGAGTLRICVGQKPTASFPPRVTSATQTAPSVAAGGTVTLRVNASDPQASALSFSWTSGGGTLGAPLSTVASSEVVWTAPSCVPATGPSVGVSAVVKNAKGLSVTQGFSVSVTGPACPAASWVATGSLGTPRLAHSASLLASGKVLVAGGQYQSSPLGSAELYDPALGTWGPTGSLREARYGHAAVVLPSGQVLVTGGYGPFYNALSSTELYDPASGNWAPGPSLVKPRSNPVALVLPSGKVLVGGSGQCTGSSSVDLYDPAARSWSSAPLLIHRYGAMLALLDSGKVLVGGTTSPPSCSTPRHPPR